MFGFYFWFGFWFGLGLCFWFDFRCRRAKRFAGTEVVADALDAHRRERRGGLALDLDHRFHFANTGPQERQAESDAEKERGDGRAGAAGHVRW